MQAFVMLFLVIAGLMSKNIYALPAVSSTDKSEQVAKVDGRGKKRILENSRKSHRTFSLFSA